MVRSSYLAAKLSVVSLPLAGRDQGWGSAAAMHRPFRGNRVKPILTALFALLLIPGAVLAEETICTPEFYYNSSEAEPVIIPIDEARAAGSMATRIDIETGAYRHTFIGATETIATGTLAIVSFGSLRERIDFVALDVTTGLVLRISLIDDGLPFVRIDADGTVASGHCVYE